MKSLDDAIRPCAPDDTISTTEQPTTHGAIIAAHRHRRVTMSFAPLRVLLAGLLLPLIAGCAGTPPRPTAAAATLRVMSFNIRLPAESDGLDRWQIRRGITARMLHDAAPDVIGTQELHREQADYLIKQLPGYVWFGRDRRGGHSDEHMGVFYRKDRLRVVESGDFWLSDTPEVAGSTGWGHPLPRMASWALFERIHDRRRFYLFNTHLPHRAEDETARVRGAQVLRGRIDALPADVPVIVTGDFNTPPTSAVHQVFAGMLTDAWEVAAQRSGPEATFHAFTGNTKDGQRIDWILVRGLDVTALRTIDTNENGRYPSDHFPVLAELVWPAG